jgi:hypothetical protein
MLDLGFPIESVAGFDMEATALNHAALHAHVEMVALLLERGADPRRPIPMEARRSRRWPGLRATRFHRSTPGRVPRRSASTT